jgi:FkbM family methyltransferase
VRILRKRIGNQKTQSLQNAALLEHVKNMVLSGEESVPISELIFDTDPSWSVSNIKNNVIHDESYLPFLEFIGGDSNIIDIGANYGYSFSSFRNLGHTGKYFAIEPLPQHSPALKVLKNQFANFQYWIGGVAAECGKNKICIPSYKKKTNSSLSSIDLQSENVQWLLRNLLTNDNLPIRFSDIGLTWIEIDTRTLDCLTNNEYSGVPINAMKIDVEGYESQVLEGARNTLEKHHPSLLIEGANRHPKVQQILSEMNYQTLRRNVNGEYSLASISEPITEINGMFVHKNVVPKKGGGNP